MTANILMDTHAAILLATGQPIHEAALDQLSAARKAGHPIHVSPITAWEIGKLSASGKIALTQPPLSWFNALVMLPGVSLSTLPPDALIDASFLPDDPPRAPVDRILIATARFHGLGLMTRNQKILSYGKKGHVLTIAC